MWGTCNDISALRTINTPRNMYPLRPGISQLIYQLDEMYNVQYTTTYTVDIRNNTAHI